MLLCSSIQNRRWHMANCNDLFIQWLDRYIEDKFKTFYEQHLKTSIEAIVIEHIEKRLWKRRLSESLPAITDAPLALNSFGYESYEHMLMPYLIKEIKNPSIDFNTLLQKIVEDLFFNPDVKQNHNIFIPLNSYDCITVYEHGEWQPRVLHTTLEKIICRANDVLQHYLVGSDSIEETVFKQELGKKKYDALREFTNRIDNLERFPELKAKLIKETEHTILTCQHRCVYQTQISGKAVAPAFEA